MFLSLLFSVSVYIGWVLTQTFSESIYQSITGLYEYQYLFTVSQLQAHPFHLLFENGPGSFKYFSLPAFTILNFVNRYVNIAEPLQRKFYLLVSVCLLGKLLQFVQSIAFSLIRLLQCLYIFQYLLPAVHSGQRHPMASGILWHPPGRAFPSPW